MMSKVIIFGILALGMSVADAADPFGLDKLVRSTFRHSLDTDCPANVTDEMKEDITNYLIGKGLDCVRFSADYWGNFSQDIAEVKTKGNSEAVTALCNKTHQVTVCIKRMAEIMGPCTGDDTVNTAKQYWDLMYDFPCGNNAERLTRFLTEGGLDCLEKTQGLLKQEIGLKFLKFCEDNSIKSPLELIKIKVEKQCGSYDDVLVGVGHAFENCNSTYPTNMTKDFSKSFKKLHNCPEHSSGAAPTPGLAHRTFYSILTLVVMALMTKVFM